MIDFDRTKGSALYAYNRRGLYDTARCDDACAVVLASDVLSELACVMDECGNISKYICDCPDITFKTATPLLATEIMEYFVGEWCDCENAEDGGE